ncbi:transferrin-binding protein-like solute binding protein [Sulfitobacter litoralis]|uniref:transferrin-binding protein-like solute binding protein n=1 Tax=Sulfitobacter litoralis TaxID=335975 RepID=UPI002B27A761|nr:transferrin-binding protein-like solute binding protein [Sulfitobacter litoralis]
MKLYIKLMTTTALALSVAACGSSKGIDKVIDVTDITKEAQAKRTFATDKDGNPVDAGGAIAAGKTLTARAVGVSLKNLNYETGKTSLKSGGTASIKRNDAGALTVTINGVEKAFKPSDITAEGDGYEVDGADGYFGVYSYTDQIADFLTAGNGYSQVIEIQRDLNDPDNPGLHENAFAVIGTETADADLKALPKAVYSGRSRVNVIPNSGFESNQESRYKVRSEVAMTADFGAGEVWGTIGNTTVQDPGSDVRDAIGGTIKMNKTSFDNNGFAGTLTADQTFINELEVDSGSGTYSGAFYGPKAEEVAGALTLGLTDGAESMNGSGFFTADKQ